MKKIIILICVLQFNISYTQVTLDADGPGNTYELITSVLAPGYNPVEVPDCNHTSFGRHIDEVYDNELNTNVFRFYIHTSPDNDRCINVDRQRNEIKTYDQSPENLLGRQNEIVVYKWKFKLEAGFKTSSNFTHLHQLKSVGGALEDMPMYTLTARKSNPDRLELRYAETDTQVTLLQTSLAPFIGTWLDVTETITYGTSGTYAIEIKRVDNDNILLNYSNNSIINWRTGASFVRPKWGIYRSLLNAQDLRDETILFANFSIEELPTLSINEADVDNTTFSIVPNPSSNIIHLKNVKTNASLIQLYSLDGRKVLEKDSNFETNVDIDISSISNGSYIIIVKGKQLYQSKLLIISH
ncbi:T9SS type A sorting domain-containing protein [Aquaticitalea lipolytica]|uniref:T9SS type A sorting domain-containing protein n=1 Tax=Aquaticitalea lipolytica TaxID=1247562 RepID=UPI0024BB400F|nr:T9SS type A sorting domain-containing protein [Aquaticitalea lipolytica]